MTQPIIGPNPSDREAWLAARQQVITSTDIARIMRGDGFTVYHEKLGDVAPFAGNAHTRRGNRFQRPLLETYAEDNRAILLDWLPLIIDGDCPALAATPDAVSVKEMDNWQAGTVTTLPHLGEDYGVELLTLGMGVEAKTSLSPRVAAELSEGDEHSDCCPTDWIWQTQAQMACVGWEIVAVAILLFGKPVYRKVTRNAELVDKCRAVATEYAERVARRLEPTLVSVSEANQASLKALYKPAMGKIIDLSPEAAEIWAKRSAASKAKSAAEKQTKAHESELRAIFADAEMGIMPDGSTLRIGTVHRDSYSVAACDYTQFYYKGVK